MAVGQQLLHHVGGVGAEHDQFAVGHVNHAHHPEGDGQADGRQQEYRAEAQAEEHCVSGLERADAGIDLFQGLFQCAGF